MYMCINTYAVLKHIHIHMCMDNIYMYTNMYIDTLAYYTDMSEASTHHFLAEPVGALPVGDHEVLELRA